MFGNGGKPNHDNKMDLQLWQIEYKNEIWEESNQERIK